MQPVRMGITGLTTLALVLQLQATPSLAGNAFSTYGALPFKPVQEARLYSAPPVSISQVLDNSKKQPFATLRNNLSLFKKSSLSIDDTCEAAWTWKGLMDQQITSSVFFEAYDNHAHNIHLLQGVLNGADHDEGFWNVITDTLYYVTNNQDNPLIQQGAWRVINPTNVLKLPLSNGEVHLPLLALVDEWPAGSSVWEVVQVLLNQGLSQMAILCQDSEKPLFDQALFNGSLEVFASSSDYFPIWMNVVFKDYFKNTLAIVMARLSTTGKLKDLQELMREEVLLPWITEQGHSMRLDEYDSMDLYSQFNRLAIVLAAVAGNESALTQFTQAYTEELESDGRINSYQILIIKRRFVQEIRENMGLPRSAEFLESSWKLSSEQQAENAPVGEVDNDNNAGDDDDYGFDDIVEEYIDIPIVRQLHLTDDNQMGLMLPAFMLTKNTEAELPDLGTWPYWEYDIDFFKAVIEPGFLPFIKCLKTSIAAPPPELHNSYSPQFRQNLEKCRVEANNSGT
ncbi:hypothetical protein H4R33_005678 [Dimargaris cristalligena]|nr:hypothetical protein H4R33_005678 [Dimargaris cristalligena]